MSGSDTCYKCDNSSGEMGFCPECYSDLFVIPPTTFMYWKLNENWPRTPCGLWEKIWRFFGVGR